MKHSQYPIEFGVDQALQLQVLAAPLFSEVFSAIRQLAAGSLDCMLVYGYAGGGKSFVLKAAVKAAEELGKSGLFLPADSLACSSSMLVEQSEHFDLIAIDDADRLLGTKHESALFHLYNRAQSSSQQLIFSMDKAPHQEEILLSDLRSRLMQAAAFDLPLLSNPSRRTEFMMHYLKVCSVQLPSKLTELLASEGPEGPAEFMQLIDELQGHLAGRSSKRIPKAFFEQLKEVVTARN